MDTKNMKNASWKKFLWIGIFLVLTAPPLESADDTQTTQADPLPLERVTKYLSERDDATTLQNNKTEKELLGKLYSGILSVSDVEEDGKDIIVKEVVPVYSELHFRVHDAALKGKARQIRKNDRILVTARRDKFWVQDSGYWNVTDTYVAEFQNVQGLDVQPQKEREPKP